MPYDNPLRITRCPVFDVLPNPANARRHPRAQIRKIADSIRAFGFNCPILVDENNRILAGHGRLEAARLLGLAEVPTIRIDQLTEAQKKAFLIADNRLTELGDWDREHLAMELKELSTADLDFDIGTIGFETAEIDLMIAEADGETEDGKKTPEKLALDLRETPVSTPGDLWQLGPHRLLCANALKAACYDRLMGDGRARMAISDPPYNVAVDGHVCGLGRVRHAEFAMASGEMTRAGFTRFLRTALRHMARVSLDGALVYVFMDWRHMGEVLNAARTVHGEPRNLCVWAKTNGGMGSFYRSQHELVFLFRNGHAPHVNNVELGRHGRYRTNFWTYPGVNSFGSERLELLRLHPTVKPVGLVADAIRDASHRNELILDPFCGSGTVLIAAERTGRGARAMELEPRYVDAAIRRWQAETGDPAIHAESGKTFAECEEASHGR